MDTAQSALLGPLFSGLLGISVSLSVLDWNALAGGNISLLSYLNVLQTDLSVADTTQVLNADVTLLQLVNAAATVAQADGNAAMVSALNALKVPVSGLTGTIKPADLLKLSFPQGALADINLSALDMFTGFVQLFNFRNVVTTPSPVVINGSALGSLGLGGVLNSVSLYLQVVEPPVYTCGPVGTTFHTAAIRLKLDMDLIDVNPDTTGVNAALSSVLNLAGTTVQTSLRLAQLGLYAEIARGDGTLVAVDALNSAVTVEAVPGVVDLYLGSMDDAIFFNRSHAVDPAKDLKQGKVGSLDLVIRQQLVLTTVTLANIHTDVLVRASSKGELPFSSTLLFTPPYPRTLTASTSAGFVTRLLQGLFNNLEIGFSSNMAVLDTLATGLLSTLTTALKGVINTALSPVLDTVLRGLVDPLLHLLGIGLGQVVVTVSGVSLCDYGDCPVSGTSPGGQGANHYGTASHAIVKGMRLGSVVADAEAGNQPALGATGDDTAGTDDEEGVTFPTLRQGMTAIIPVAVSGSGYLQAWIDWDGNGGFEGTDEQVASNLQDGAGLDTAASTGTLAFAVTVPESAYAGQTYARFRWSGTPGLGATGGNADGEVEDHVVTIATKAGIRGRAYTDSNNNGSYDAGVDAPLNGMDIVLHDESGTPGNPADDSQVARTTTASDGSYGFFPADTQKTYRVTADTTTLPAITEPLVASNNPQYNLSLLSGQDAVADLRFTAFNCSPGGGQTDPAIRAYVSTEVRGNSSAARTYTDTLDNDWRSAAGLPATGPVRPWLGYAATTALGNQAAALFTTYGVTVDVALVNIQPSSPCMGSINSQGAPGLSIGNTLQANAPRPASLYALNAQPAFWTEATGDSQSQNAVRFTFSQPVKAFGAWFGDLETRTDGLARPAYLRLLDSTGNRVGEDIEIVPATISSGSLPVPVNQGLCGGTATDSGCGNTSTRWVGFVDNTAVARVKHALVMVGDDDYGETGGAEGLSFIGADIGTTAPTTYSVEGKVYLDTNVSAANDTEPGIKDVTVVLHDPAANTCRSVKTGADGSYTFTGVSASTYTLLEAAGASVPAPGTCPPAVNDPDGYVSTTANQLTVTVTTANVVGQDFGDVKAPTFTLDNAKSTLPDTVVSYPHVFRTAVDGVVTFSVAGETADPDSLHWGVTLHKDGDCDGKLGKADTALDGPLTVSAGDKVCILAKVLSPADVTGSATHTLAVQSSFRYGDGSSSLPDDLQTHQDITTVAGGTAEPTSPYTPANGAGKLLLEKAVWNVTRNSDGEVALPGETLRYTISYRNIGDGELDELVVHDSVPAFTTLVGSSQVCGTTPPELSACTPAVSGTALDWTFNGKLQPGSSGEVNYEVSVN